MVGNSCVFGMPHRALGKLTSPLGHEAPLVTAMGDDCPERKQRINDVPINASLLAPLLSVVG